MEINITDEQIQQMAEEEVRKYIAKKIQKVMDDGCAYWFTQQNIMNLTRGEVYRKIDNIVVQDMMAQVDADEIARTIAKAIVNYFGLGCYD